MEGGNQVVPPFGTLAEEEGEEEVKRDEREGIMIWELVNERWPVVGCRLGCVRQSAGGRLGDTRCVYNAVR